MSLAFLRLEKSGCQEPDEQSTRKYHGLNPILALRAEPGVKLDIHMFGVINGKNIRLKGNVLPNAVSIVLHN